MEFLKNVPMMILHLPIENKQYIMFYKNYCNEQYMPMARKVIENSKVKGGIDSRKVIVKEGS